MEGSPQSSSPEIDDTMLEIAEDAIAFENMDPQAVVDELNRTQQPLDRDPAMNSLLETMQFGTTEEQMSAIFGLSPEEIAAISSEGAEEREVVSNLIWEINEDVEALGGGFKHTAAFLRSPFPVAAEQEAPTVLKALINKVHRDEVITFTRSDEGWTRIMHIVRGGGSQSTF